MLKVLIVEDDIFLGNVYRVKLKESGIDSEVVGTCDGIVEKTRTNSPDIIILDLVMPEISGYKALELLKKDSTTSKIPVVVVTRLSADSDVQKCKKLGASEFVVKSDLSFVDVMGILKPYIDNAIKT